MDEPIQTEMPRSTKGEAVLTGARILANLIPGAGGAVAELIGALVEPQLSKRRVAWYESVAEGLEAARRKLAAHEEKLASLDPERLSQDPAFVSTFLQASQVAMRTHHQEKLEALRNAVVNSALPHAPDDDLKIVFLNILDTLAPWHLRLLDFLDGPGRWMVRHGIERPPNPVLSGTNLVDYAFPELEIYKSYRMMFLDDLFNRGLLRPEWNEARSYSPHSLRAGSRTSDLGKRLLAFIRPPGEAPDEQALGEQ